MASNIIVCGGTATLPGFHAQLQSSLVSRLTLAHPPSPPPSPSASASEDTNNSQSRRQRLSRRLSSFRSRSRYAPLAPLANHIAIVNDPTSRMTSPGLPVASGSAPAFAPSLLAWVGGSLAGALKTGGREIKREEWLEAMDDARRKASTAPGEYGLDEASALAIARARLIPDWTKTSLPTGVPVLDTLPRTH